MFETPTDNEEIWNVETVLVMMNLVADFWKSLKNLSLNHCVQLVNKSIRKGIFPDTENTQSYFHLSK